MILILQTNLDDRVECWFVKRGVIIARQSRTQSFEHRAGPLVLIEQLLKKAKTTPQKMTGVVIVRGPGRFSSVRTGIIIGNILSQELQIPILGLVKKALLSDDHVLAAAAKVQTLKKYVAVKPWYGKKPNITKPSPKKVQKKRYA